MNILLISSLLSNNLLDDIRKITGQYPAYAVQKFYRVLAAGLCKNKSNVTVLSNPPAFMSEKRERFLNYQNDSEDGVNYRYVPFLNFSVIRHLCLFIYTFLYVFGYGFKKRKDKAIVCDILCYSTCLAALLAAKITGVKIVGLVTDLPWLVDEEGKVSFKMRIFGAFTKWYIKKYAYYVFLTEQMNEVINKKLKPYIVIEGFANIEMENVENLLEKKDSPKTIMYAGFLQEKYGLKMLVEGFMTLKDLDAKLVIYGTGPYSEELEECTKIDSRVEYRGFAANSVIVEAELKASVLINPRPTHEEYTKYSFPSKNMEYMASGTPILTTKLPGMPLEYYPYIYHFEDETTEGYARVIKEVLNKQPEELHKKGADAKAWVMSKKNNVVQSARILNMLS
ncbi:glycosyltransferase [uncultured Bacteroides sp.]|uniref:glycosyltransferase n=1 Tax=uncultured Bacteroides sp. TaxID=162156 RepID=UPI002AA8A9B5|nr:glycosyltransferase [uncultured Bacteroides sp.]